MLTAAQMLRAMSKSTDPIVRKMAEETIAEKAADKRRAKAVRRQKRGPAPGQTKEERDEETKGLYTGARREAFERAGAVFDEDGEIARSAWCEVFENGQRCLYPGDDPDHVLGGSYRQECERLGAEGLQVKCRRHHDLKHANSPTRRYWLDNAKAHALRLGFRRLLALVEKAIARDEMKHPEARGAPEEKP